MLLDADVNAFGAEFVFGSASVHWRLVFRDSRVTRIDFANFRFRDDLVRPFRVGTEIRRRSLTEYNLRKSYISCPENRSHW